MFLRGRGRVSAGAVRAVAAVTLTVQAESDGRTRRGQRSAAHRQSTSPCCEQRNRMCSSEVIYVRSFLATKFRLKFINRKDAEKGITSG